MFRSNQIVDVLRNEIISGQLSEGEALRELALAERFQVSRGPIRAALQQLVHEGMVVTKPNCGARVARNSANSIEDLVIPLRRIVETFALRSFFHEITAQDYEVWDKMLADMHDACQQKDYLRIVEADIAFHRSIVERASEVDLLAIWAPLVARMQRHFFSGYQKRYDEPLKIYYEHVAIVAMFRTGKLDASIDTLIQNIE